MAAHHVWLVLSGKGGVGKSSVCAQLAMTLCLAGHHVAVLDVDLCGPSVPTMFRVQGAEVRQGADGWIPVPVVSADASSQGQQGQQGEIETRTSQGGTLHCMSIGFLLGGRDDAVVWRGPRKQAMIRQLVDRVCWPANIDYLLVDTPPGTSDEHLAIVEQLLPVVLASSSASSSSPPSDIVDGHNHVATIVGRSGAILVTTPQSVALVDVQKEYTFCRRLNMPVLGLVENMGGGFVCPHCAHCTDDMFSGAVDADDGMSEAQRFCRDRHIQHLGMLPIDPQLAQLLDGTDKTDGQMAGLDLLHAYARTSSSSAMKLIVRE